MFGQNFSYEKQPKILEDGDYKVTLGKPFETQVGNYSVLRFPFMVDGETGTVVPNYFDLFDVVNPYDEEKVRQFRKHASRIKACFKLDGSFCENNYNRWAGHKGEIRIERSDAGFVNVVRYYKADMTPEEERSL